MTTNIYIYIQVCYIISFCFKFLFLCMLVGMCTVIYIIGDFISFCFIAMIKLKQKTIDLLQVT